MKRTTVPNKSPTANKQVIPEDQIPLSKIQTLSAIIARMELAGKLGQSYGGDRDLYEALGYSVTLTYNDYVRRFIRQDIARAIIERPVKVTWSGPLLLVESNEENETGLEDAWKNLERDLKLKSKFIRLDKLTGLGRYGVMLLGFDDITKIEDYAKPVSKRGKRKLLYVRPLGESGAVISTWERNVNNERYGLPLIYDVVLTEPSSGLSSTISSTSSNIKVHYSRVIHVVENAMESETEGSPRLEVVYNRLEDLEKLIGGSAEMFWRGARPGYTGDLDKEFTMGATEKAALQDQFDEYEHNLRRILVNEGLTLKTLETQISDPKNHVDVQLMMISAVTGIPKRILSGSERGELASSQDAVEWGSFVQSRREEFAEPHIIRPFVDRMIEFGVLPEATDGYSIEWADIFAVSEHDKVEIGRIRATALREYFVNPLTPEVVPPRAFYEFFLGFGREQIELMMAMETDDTIRSIREEDAAFQAELKKDVTEPVIVPEQNETAKPTADKKTKNLNVNKRA